MTTPPFAADQTASKTPAHSPASSYTLLRLPAVLKLRGRSRSSHYEDMERGLFTRQVNLGVRSVGWPEHEVIALNEARIAEMGDDEIRALVKRLEAARKAR